MKKLSVQWLDYLINGDPGLADQISHAGVRCLVNILVGIDSHEEGEDILKIQMYSVQILSCTRLHQHSTVVVPALVKLMSNPRIELKTVGVMALTRLANASQDCIKDILERGALEKSHEIAKNLCLLYLDDIELMHRVALFMAVVCRCKDLAHEKVKVAFTISEEIFEKYSLKDHQHIVPTCYALMYLAYGRPMALEDKEFKKLIGRLTGFISNRFGVKDTVNLVVAGSALGVIGNIARWGNDNQIQVLARESKLLQCLEKILCSMSKKLVLESCVILSNIAARREAWIQVMPEVKLIEPLGNLLAYSTHD